MLPLDGILPLEYLLILCYCHCFSLSSMNFLPSVKLAPKSLDIESLSTLLVRGFLVFHQSGNLAKEPAFLEDGMSSTQTCIQHPHAIPHISSPYSCSRVPFLKRQRRGGSS